MAKVGSTVLYRLSEQDAVAINRHRADAKLSRVDREQDRFVMHIGNEAIAGAVYPAQVVAQWQGYEHVNLHVFLDGNDTYWATSRSPGEKPGQWVEF